MMRSAFAAAALRRQREAAAAPQTVEVQVPEEFQAQEEALKAGVKDLPRDPELEQAAAQLGAPVEPIQPPEDPLDKREMDAALEADRQARNNARLELASRQFVSGLTQTPLGQMSPAVPSQVPFAQDAAKRRSARAADALRYRKQAEDEAARAKERAAAQAESLRRFNVSEEGKAKALEAQQSNAEAMRELARASQGLGREKFEEEKAENARARAAKAAEEAEKTKREDEKKAIEAESQKIPFTGGTFVPRAGVKIPETVFNRATADAASFQGATAAIGALEQALARFAKDPSPANRGDVKTTARGAMAALNSAQGQGAMAEGEAAAMKEALGSELLSSSGVQALVGSLLGQSEADVVKAITRQAGAARTQLDMMAKARMKTANLEWKPFPKSPGPSYRRARVDGVPGWYSQEKNDFEADP